MKTNMQTKVEGADVITQTKMVKIDGRSFRMTSTIRKVESIVPAAKRETSSSFSQLAQNVAKAKARKH